VVSPPNPTSAHESATAASARPSARPAVRQRRVAASQKSSGQRHTFAAISAAEIKVEVRRSPRERQTTARLSASKLRIEPIRKFWTTGYARNVPPYQRQSRTPSTRRVITVAATSNAANRAAATPSGNTASGAASTAATGG